MKRVLGWLIVAVTMLQTGVSSAQVSSWLEAHPKVAFSLKWQYSVGGSYYDIREANKISWTDWSSEQKQALEDAYAEALDWYNSADPYQNLDEDIVYPPVNLCDGDDTDKPRTCVDEPYAWELYLRWVATNLVVEIEGAVPWSIEDYDTDTLKLIFDSSSIMTRSGDDIFRVGAEYPEHGSFLFRHSNMGSSLIAPPRYTLAFLQENDLIGTDRLDTIERVLQWASDNLWHFVGSQNYGIMEYHWQYRGLPPITKIIEGTLQGGNLFGHWTAGCHGTNGFFRNVLRAVNIPVRIDRVCGHSQAEFVTEGLYLDHGDNPYNLSFVASGLPVGDLLIDRMTYLTWFGANPFNHADEEFCAEGVQKIGHRVNVLVGNAEDCLDGADNDGDGAIDCEDSECGPIGVLPQTKLNASNGAANDGFGSAADIDGTTAVVGAYHKTTTLGENAGAVYVYEYVDDEGWVQSAVLMPSDGGESREFGYAVAIDGETLISGSDTADGFTGEAYVFVRENGVWTQQTKLNPVGMVAGDRFGISMDIEGDLVAVGAFGDDDQTGAVYLFRRSGTTWSQEAVLTASDGAAGDLFGYDVSISEDAVIVGAYSAATSEPAAGAAYVFRFDGDGWQEEGKLTASDAVMYHNFGYSVALSGDLAVVGASHDSEIDSFAGAAYVYRFVNDDWVFSQKLTASDAWPLDAFGVDVSADAPYVVVGAYGEHHIGPHKSTSYTPLDNVGAAYVFEDDGSTLVEVRKLIADDGVADDRFGYTVPISGTTVLVGAYGNDDAGELSGSAYIIQLGETAVGYCSEISAVNTAGGESPVSLYFSEIIEGGETTVTVSNTGAALPDGYQLGTPPTYLDIETSADYVDAVEICIDYSEVAYSDEGALTLLHYEGGEWVDLCEDSDACVVDTGSDVICAMTETLSPFVVAQVVSLFDNVTLIPGQGTGSAVFLAEELGAVGTQALLDVIIPFGQPNPYWLGQIQMTASIPALGLNAVDMGTVQLTGLAEGATHTLTFTVPASVRDALLTGISGGKFTVHSNTPDNAPALTVTNFRFSGTMTERGDDAPIRGSLAEFFSFETVDAWSAAGATLSSETGLVTDGAASLRVDPAVSYAVVESADFLTDEIAAGVSELSLDVLVDGTFSWGQLQATLACPEGTNIYLGQVSLTALTPNAFETIRFPLTAAQALIAEPGNICSVQLAVNAAVGPTLYFDYLTVE